MHDPSIMSERQNQKLGEIPSTQYQQQQTQQRQPLNADATSEQKSSKSKHRRRKKKKKQPQPLHNDNLNNNDRSKDMHKNSLQNAQQKIDQVESGVKDVNLNADGDRVIRDQRPKRTPHSNSINKQNMNVISPTTARWQLPDVQKSTWNNFNAGWSHVKSSPPADSKQPAITQSYASSPFQTSPQSFTRQSPGQAQYLGWNVAPSEYRPSQLQQMQYSQQSSQSSSSQNPQMMDPNIFDTALRDINQKKTSLAVSSQFRSIEKFLKHSLIPMNEEFCYRRGDYSYISPGNIKDIYLIHPGSLIITDHHVNQAGDVSGQSILASVMAIRDVALITGNLYVYQPQMSLVEKQVMLALSLSPVTGTPIDEMLSNASSLPSKSLYWINGKDVLDISERIVSANWGPWGLHSVVIASQDIRKLLEQKNQSGDGQQPDQYEKLRKVIKYVAIVPITMPQQSQPQQEYSGTVYGDQPQNSNTQRSSALYTPPALLNSRTPRRLSQSSLASIGSMCFHYFNIAHLHCLDNDFWGFGADSDDPVDLGPSRE
ncbi:hypothetical protein MIR68_002672 [Amoeboaphelidium protococcarum]|nr:hypothetical protein MIR68_002672 [Amoeboaphelidium protococcarum]